MIFNFVLRFPSIKRAIPDCRYASPTVIPVLRSCSVRGRMQRSRTLLRGTTTLFSKRLADLAGRFLFLYAV